MGNILFPNRIMRGTTALVALWQFQGLFSQTSSTAIPSPPPSSYTQTFPSIVAAAPTPTQTDLLTEKLLPHQADGKAELLPPLPSSPLYGAPENDYDCISEPGRNPVVLLHQLGANRDNSLNLLHRWLRSQGFCVFAWTYGANNINATTEGVSSAIGGLGPMPASADFVAGQIRKIAATATAQQHGGSSGKVSIVGHSEGAVMALYAPLRDRGLTSLLDVVVAWAPAVHGAPYYGLAEGAPGLMRLAFGIPGGCQACSDMMSPDGVVYQALRDASPRNLGGSKGVYILASEHDTLVPPEISFIHGEGTSSIRNVMVQSYCPGDTTGHEGMPYDATMWHLTLDALLGRWREPGEGRDWKCGGGLPI